MVGMRFIATLHRWAPELRPATVGFPDTPPEIRTDMVLVQGTLASRPIKAIH